MQKEFFNSQIQALARDSCPLLFCLQAEMAGQAHDSTPSMLQLPDSEELRSHHQPEGGRAFLEGTPVSNSPPQSTAGQYATPLPQGEVPTYTEAQPESMSEAIPTPESAASGKFVTPPESPESFPYDPTQESRVPFQADTRPHQPYDSTPQQYVTPTPEQAQHDVPHFAEHAAASSEAVSQRLTQAVDDSGSYTGGPESAQGVYNPSQVVPSGEGTPMSGEGQLQGEVTPTEAYQSQQGQQVSHSTIKTIVHPDSQLPFCTDPLLLYTVNTMVKSCMQSVSCFQDMR